MEWEEEARQRLGPEAWDQVLEAVDLGKLSERQAQDLASRLHPKVAGKFIRERDRRDFQYDRTAMRQILLDWFVEDPAGVSLAKLVEALKSPDIRLLPLAQKLESMGETAKKEERDSLFKKLKETFEKFDIKGIQEKLDEYKSATINIAVTGQSGSGKSSLINRLRGLTPKDKDRKDSEGNPLYAPVGVKETTTERKCYAFPDNPLIKLWDLPGAGTKSFQIANYAKDMKFEEYDAFVFLTKDRFDENDTEIAKTISNLHKPFFLARSKMDNTIDSEALDQEENFSASETMNSIRDNCKEELGDAAQEIYLLSRLESMKVKAGEEEVTVGFPDNDRLKKNIITCMNGIQRTALGMFCNLQI